MRKLCGYFVSISCKPVRELLQDLTVGIINAKWFLPSTSWLKYLARNTAIFIHSSLDWLFSSMLYIALVFLIRSQRIFKKSVIIFVWFAVISASLSNCFS